MGRWILGLLACLPLVGTTLAAELALPAPEIRALDLSVADATASEVTSGKLDSHFTSVQFDGPLSRGEIVWLRIQTPVAIPGSGTIPVLIVHAGMLHKVQVYAASTTLGARLPVAAHAPEFAGARDTAFILPLGQ